MNKPTLKDLFKDSSAYEKRNERVDFSKFSREAEDMKRIRTKLETSANIDIESLKKLKFTR